VVAALANRQQGIRQGMSGNAPAQKRASKGILAIGAKLRIRRELLAECRQFAPDPSLGAHKLRYPQNSKSLPAKSNSSKRGLTIRGMFTPRQAFALLYAPSGAGV
jgi:hypothetical protein